MSNRIEATYEKLPLFFDQILPDLDIFRTISPIVQVQVSNYLQLQNHRFLFRFFE